MIDLDSFPEMNARRIGPHGSARISGLEKTKHALIILKEDGAIYAMASVDMQSTGLNGPVKRLWPPPRRREKP